MIIVKNNRNMDERQEIINKNMLIRSFGFLFILLIIYIAFLGVINVTITGHQLILISIITLTSIYMWIDSFINKILYYDVQNNKEIKRKLSSCVTTLLVIDVAVLILAFLNKIDINISFLFLAILISFNIIVLSVYYIILKFWLIWYK